MVQLTLRLHPFLGELCRGRTTLVRRLPAITNARDALEAAGVPHVELGRVSINGRPAALSDLVGDGDELAAEPAPPRPLAHPRFLCDHHLGKLVRLLRFCGFDTLHDATMREPQLALLAARTGRAVLSRHRALLKRNQVTVGLLVRSDRADEQLVEVLRRFVLADAVGGVGRCTRCNGTLAALKQADVTAPIPPRTAAWLDDYWQCRDCGQLFWEGTHVERLRRRVQAAVTVARNPV